MFHLMPYRTLPADFSRRHRSVWVDIPSELFDPAVGHRCTRRWWRAPAIFRAVSRGSKWPPAYSGFSTRRFHHH